MKAYIYILHICRPFVFVEVGIINFIIFFVLCHYFMLVLFSEIEVTIYQNTSITFTILLFDQVYIMLVLSRSEDRSTCNGESSNTFIFIDGMTNNILLCLQYWGVTYFFKNGNGYNLKFSLSLLYCMWLGGDKAIL